MTVVFVNVNLPAFNEEYDADLSIWSQASIRLFPKILFIMVKKCDI
jgi:hypothetical protein